MTKQEKYFDMSQTLSLSLLDNKPEDSNLSRRFIKHEAELIPCVLNVLTNKNISNELLFEIGKRHLIIYDTFLFRESDNGDFVHKESSKEEWVHNFERNFAKFLLPTIREQEYYMQSPYEALSYRCYNYAFADRVIVNPNLNFENWLFLLKHSPIAALKNEKIREYILLSSRGKILKKCRERDSERYIRHLSFFKDIFEIDCGERHHVFFSKMPIFSQKILGKNDLSEIYNFDFLRKIGTKDFGDTEEFRNFIKNNNIFYAFAKDSKHHFLWYLLLDYIEESERLDDLEFSLMISLLEIFMANFLQGVFFEEKERVLKDIPGLKELFKKHKDNLLLRSSRYDYRFFKLTHHKVSSFFDNFVDN